MGAITTPVDLFPEITDLFDLDVRTTPIAMLPTTGRSADCTNDGCTGSCASCGCR